MLVLSRKENQEIVIGEDVVIRVTKINGNRVSIAIEAPRDIKILRGEISNENSIHRQPESNSSISGVRP